MIQARGVTSQVDSNPWEVQLNTVFEYGIHYGLVMLRMVAIISAVVCNRCINSLLGVTGV